MKVMYTKKLRPNDFHNPRFTFKKEYDVLADYRERKPMGCRDNGLVIKDDLGAINMIFQEEVIITDNEIGDTFVFKYKREVQNGKE